MRIEVTQEDIDKGEPHECSRCPIALAILRIPGVTGVEATVIDTSVWVGQRSFNQITPCSAYQFIKAFDRGEKVSPFSFDLDIPEFSS